jgi:predicted enzyme related to lactoylglutathione lyase
MNNVPAAQTKPRVVGFELYYQDLDLAKRFYQDILGMELTEDQAGHHARFDEGAAFLCLERKGVESYPSRDKAVVFIEVPDIEAMIEKIGRERVLHVERRADSKGPAWAVLHDPEGHNVLLLQAKD